jgi:serine/threonine-protein kinase
MQAPPIDPARYQVRHVLGRGGMSTVHLAYDAVLGRPVALKVLAEHLTEDEAFRARFLREAKLAARVMHPNVVQVYDAGEGESGLYIVMEYVDGESLADELRRRGSLSAAEVVDLGIQLCAALDASHAAGLVHRDVKPQNVLRARDGTVKLGDFGIARSQDATSLTEHGSVLGTAAYLSPEQARGAEVTGASDLYALGVVLYEALTGRRPHEGATFAELVLRREQDPVLPPGVLVAGVPPDLDRVILGCLAARPEQRPASAAAVAGTLAAALPEAATRPIPAAPDARATEVKTAATLAAATRAVERRAPTRHRLAAALVVLGALAAGILVSVFAFGGSGDEKTAPPATTRARVPTQVAVVHQQTQMQQPVAPAPHKAKHAKKPHHAKPQHAKKKHGPKKAKHGPKKH